MGDECIKQNERNIHSGFRHIWGYENMGMQETLNDFISQSQRVLNVTHKPAGPEFKQIAISTAIGIAVVGVIGFIIHTFANLFRG
jgi:protein transport protein SEC61 subunit gamma-like protein